METGGFIAWCLGKVITCSAIVVCLVANVFWIFSEKQGFIFQIFSWHEDVLHRVTSTYIYLITSLLLTCISISYVFQSPIVMQYMILHPNIVVISTVLIMTALTTMLEVIPYIPQYSLWKNLLWAAHSIAMGPSLAYFGSHICSVSSLSTAFALALATVVSFVAPKDLYLSLENKLAYIYATVTVASILCILFSPPTTSLGVLFIALNFYGGMLLYFSVFIVNTQFFLNDTSSHAFDPVYTSCVMYLCSLNLFLRIAMYYVVELTNLTDSKE